MSDIAATGRKLTHSRIAIGLLGVALVALIVAYGPADILKAATGGDQGLGGEDNGSELVGLADAANKLAGWALPVTIAVAPLACAGGALAMQFGGSKRAVPVIYASIGAVVIVVLAKALAA